MKYILGNQNITVYQNCIQGLRFISNVLSAQVTEDVIECGDGAYLFIILELDF